MQESRIVMTGYRVVTDDREGGSNREPPRAELLGTSHPGDEFGAGIDAEAGLNEDAPADKPPNCWLRHTGSDELGGSG